MRAVLEEADDEVVGSIRNVEEGEFRCERGMPDSVEFFGKVQREEGNIRLDGQVDIVVFWCNAIKAAVVEPVGRKAYWSESW